ncbi:hypothetical protein [Sphingobacterium sp. NPDC055431]
MSSQGGVGKLTNIYPSEGSPLASGSFPVAEKWIKCRCLCDGIGLGMLSEDHPIKRDDLLKDIPDNKAFYPCVGARAKSHLKWAEAFWLLLGFKSNKVSVRKCPITSYHRPSKMDDLFANTYQFV